MAEKRRRTLCRCVSCCAVGITACVAALAVGSVTMKGTCFCFISVRQVLRRTCLEGAVGFMTAFTAGDEACSWYNSNSLRCTQKKRSHCFKDMATPFCVGLTFPPLVLVGAA